MQYEIKINNEILSYDNVCYIDCENGNDTTGDGTEQNPVQTIVGALNKKGANCQFLLKPGFYQVFGTDLYFPRQLVQLQLGTVTIETNCPNQWKSCFSYFVYCYCYGITFQTNPTSHSSSYVFDEMNRIIDRKITFHNCVFKNPFIGYQHFAYGGGIFKNCLLEHQIKNYSGSNSYENCIYDNPNQGLNINISNYTYDANYNILTGTWKNIGQGLNPDGTQQNIGVYGGVFAWGEWFKQKFILKYDNQLKYYNEQNNTFEDIQDNELSLSNFETYGSDDKSFMFETLKQAQFNLNSFYIFNMRSSMDNIIIKVVRTVNKNIIKIKQIDLNNFKDIEYVKMYLNELSNLNDIRIFFKQNNQYISLRNNKIVQFEVNNAVNETNKMLSIYEFNNLKYDDIIQLSDDQKLNMYLFLNNKNRLNNISLKGDYNGKYNVQENEYLTTELYNNKIKIKLFENTNYRIRLLKN